MGTLCKQLLLQLYSDYFETIQNFGQIWPLTVELAALECLKNKYFVAPSTLIGSSSFLKETRITITSWMGSNWSQIRPWTAELAALECLKNLFLLLWPLQHLQFWSDFQKNNKKEQKKKNKNKRNKNTLSSDCTCWLSGERLLPLGYLFLWPFKSMFRSPLWVTEFTYFDQTSDER